MAEYQVELTAKEEVTGGTMAFTFEKPSDFDYIAGQSIDITLIDPPKTDSKGNTRTFSLVSAPYQDHLKITTRLRESAFKDIIEQLKVGTKVKIDGPYGSFTLHYDHETPAVFLTGGVGITPFMSMLKQATKDGRTNDLHLFYSSRTEADLVFHEELEELVEENGQLEVIYTLTREKPDNWQGETGRISQNMIETYLNDLDEPIYYIAGPPKMVTSMRGVLDKCGVDPDKVKYEDFAGY